MNDYVKNKLAQLKLRLSFLTKQLTLNNISPSDKDQYQKDIQKIKKDIQNLNK